MLGEDGHPRKVSGEEDPYHMGLVLEWVYGTIVSTAEKARDGAKRPLGMGPAHLHGEQADTCFGLWSSRCCERLLSKPAVEVNLGASGYTSVAWGMKSMIGAMEIPACVSQSLAALL